MKNTLLLLFAILSLTACGGGGDEGGETPSGGNEYLNVSDITIPTGNTTATLYIKASANCDWTITCTESWVSFSDKKGRGDLNVTVTVTTDGEKITDIKAAFDADRLKAGMVLKKGKKTFKKITL